MVDRLRQGALFFFGAFAFVSAGPVVVSLLNNPYLLQSLRLRVGHCYRSLAE